MAPELAVTKNACKRRGRDSSIYRCTQTHTMVHVHDKGWRGCTEPMDPRNGQPVALGWFTTLSSKQHLVPTPPQHEPRNRNLQSRSHTHNHNHQNNN